MSGCVFMIIPLNHDVRIVGTERCWELQHRSFVKGVERWRADKYFHEFGSAVQEAAQEEIRTDSAASLTEALEAFERVGRRYQGLLDNAVADVSERANTVGKVAA